MKVFCSHVQFNNLNGKRAVETKIFGQPLLINLDEKVAVWKRDPSEPAETHKVLSEEEGRICFEPFAHEF